MISTGAKKTRLDSLSVYASTFEEGDVPDLDSLAEQISSGNIWDESADCLGMAAQAEITTSTSTASCNTLSPSNSSDSGFPDDLMDNLVSDNFNFESILGENPAAAHEPFTFLNDHGMQGLENGGKAEDTIKTDCMWSSSLDSVLTNKTRNRDVSLSLSECAENLFGELPELEETAKNLLGSSPGGIQSMLKSYMDGPTGSDGEDEEIDVVSDCDARSTCSSSTVSASSSASTASNFHHPHYGKIKAGQSLLKNNRKLQQNSNSSNNNRQTLLKQPVTSNKALLASFNSDHCYFITPSQQQQQQQQQQQYMQQQQPRGILTPNESSEDDDDEMTASRTNLYRRANPVMYANAKLNSHNSSQVKPKFTFRMTMNKEELPDGVYDADTDDHNSSRVVVTTNRKRRSSAMKNSHCPSPQKLIAPQKVLPQQARVIQQRQIIHQVQQQQHVYSAPFTASSSARPSPTVIPPAAKARYVVSCNHKVIHQISIECFLLIIGELRCWLRGLARPKSRARTETCTTLWSAPGGST